MSRRFARAGGPTGSEFYQGANNLVASATPHTLGPWSEIDASVAQDCSGLWIASATVIGVSATVTSMILELGFGAAAAELMQVQLFVGSQAIGVFAYVPLHIPAGTRLSGRIQGAVVSDIYTPLVILEYCRGRFGFGGYSVGEAIGLNAATSAPTTGDLTDNAFDQAIASTVNPYRALSLHYGSIVTNQSAGTGSIDVAVGAAAAEVILGQWYFQVSGGEQLVTQAGVSFIEVNIPVGARLSIRKNSTVDLTGHLIGWR